MSLVRTGFVEAPQPGFDHADVYRAGRRYFAHTAGKGAVVRSLYVVCPDSGGAMLFEEHG